MANYSGPVCRFCRREGAKLYLKVERCYTPKCAIERRAFAPGVNGLNLLRHLELRLDNVVYRLGLGSSRKQARQLVTHRHFEINGKTVNVPSFQLKPGDEVKVKPANGVFDLALEASKVRPVP